MRRISERRIRRSNDLGASYRGAATRARDALLVDAFAETVEPWRDELAIRVALAMLGRPHRAVFGVRERGLIRAAGGCVRASARQGPQQRQHDNEQKYSSCPTE